MGIPGLLCNVLQPGQQPGIAHATTYGGQRARPLHREGDQRDRFFRDLGFQQVCVTLGTFPVAESQRQIDRGAVEEGVIVRRASQLKDSLRLFEAAFAFFCIVGGCGEGSQNWGTKKK